MIKAWNVVSKYIANNALHKKSGKRICDVSEKDRLEHLALEVRELIDEPGDIAEMADVLALLFHQAQYRGFTMEELEAKIIEKLGERLDYLRSDSEVL